MWDKWKPPKSAWTNITVKGCQWQNIRFLSTCSIKTERNMSMWVAVSFPCWVDSTFSFFPNTERLFHVGSIWLKYIVLTFCPWMDYVTQRFLNSILVRYKSRHSHRVTLGPLHICLPVWVLCVVALDCWKSIAPWAGNYIIQWKRALAQRNFQNDWSDQRGNNKQLFRLDGVLYWMNYSLFSHHACPISCGHESLGSPQEFYCFAFIAACLYKLHFLC